MNFAAPLAKVALALGLALSVAGAADAASMMKKAPMHKMMKCKYARMKNGHCMTRAMYMKMHKGMMMHKMAPKKM
ncbi:MAG: hypothetical protein KGI57_09770 [Hyphomicrobiales bacterium]|nr:hypothetical protein [Hyphomicrobiales bacterium]